MNEERPYAPVSSALLLLVLGVWLLLQTMIGDLPRRILSWRWASGSAKPATGTFDGGGGGDFAGGGATGTWDAPATGGGA